MRFCNMKIFLQVFFYFAVPFLLTAQDSTLKNYDQLRMLLKMQLTYTPDSDVHTLLDSADTYAKLQDFEMAMIFLQEARNQISQTGTPDSFPENIPPVSSPYQFKISAISGVDFNRQEFELGYSQSDSVLVDQINKPYVGLQLGLTKNGFSIENIVRYDQENLDNSLNLFLEKKLGNHRITARGGYILNNNYTYANLSFNEFLSDLTWRYDNKIWSISLQNLSRLKKYRQPDKTVPDFFRNTINGGLFYIPGAGSFVDVNYQYDVNNSLKTDNNEFTYHNGTVEWRQKWGYGFSTQIATEGTWNRYFYLVGDSLLNNRALTWKIPLQIAYNVTEAFALRLAAEGGIKKYRVKTEQEPDYLLWNSEPQVLWHTAHTSLGIGLIWEKRKHFVYTGLDSVYIKQQDYMDRGLSLTFDYSLPRSVLLSLNVSFKARRYADVVELSDFALYADNNVWSGMLFLQWPLTKHFTFNAVALYDNDKDLDSSFNDSKSSFYTIELKYDF